MKFLELLGQDLTSGFHLDQFRCYVDMCQFYVDDIQPEFILRNEIKYTTLCQSSYLLTRMSVDEC